jgi:hypothetical protein
VDRFTFFSLDIFALFSEVIETAQAQRARLREEVRI